MVPVHDDPRHCPARPARGEQPLHGADTDPRPAAPAGGVDERPGERAGLDLGSGLRGADAPVDRAVAVEPAGCGMAGVPCDRSLVGSHDHQGIDAAVAVVGVEPVGELRVQVEARAGERPHRVAVAPVAGKEAARLARGGGRELAALDEGHLDPELGQVEGARGPDDPASADDDVHDSAPPFRACQPSPAV